MHRGDPLAGPLYVSTYQDVGDSIVGDRLAEVVDELPCNDTGGEDPVPSAGPGEALGTYIGSNVYAVKGYRMSFRIANVRDGEVQLFENAHDPEATDGADILDLRDKLRRTTTEIFVSPHNTQRVRITEPERLAWLANEIERSPIGDGPNANRGRVIFDFKDGTQTFVTFAPEAGILADRLELPPDVVRALTPG